MVVKQGLKVRVLPRNASFLQRREAVPFTSGRLLFRRLTRH